MKIKLFSILLLLVYSIEIRAQEAKFEIVDLVNNYKIIESVEFDAKLTIKFNNVISKFFDEKNVNEMDGNHRIFSYKGNANSYQITLSQKLQDGSEVRKSKAWCDGDMLATMRLGRAKTNAIITKDTRDGGVCFNSSTPIFYPLSFVYSSQNDRNNHIKSLEDIHKFDLNNLSFQSVKGADKKFDAIVMTSEYTYKLVFSRDVPLITSFERYNNKGKLLQKYEVISVGSILINDQTFYYPHKALINEYLISIAGHHFEGASVSVEVTNVKANQNYDEMLFLFDPSLADSIYDKDENKWILIPQ